MLALHRSFLLFAALALASLLTLYFTLSVVKPLALWNWLDIFGEGGTAVMSGVWLVMVLGARPRGRVTTLLALSLLAIMLGAWTDCLDEFFQVDKAALWDNILESVLMPAGVVLLTAGLFYWRDEQRALSQHLLGRERVFRDHRAFDRVTQLADVGYLISQLQLEQSERPNARAALLMLDVDGFRLINREHGQREGDRLLQALSQLLLLNLRQKDLLCRYAGDRFAVLLPDANPALAQRTCAQLKRMLETLRLHTQEHAVLAITVRIAWAMVEGEPEALLAKLNRSLDGAGEREFSDRVQPA